MDSNARIIEVFPSIQGEGVYVGQPHLFIRFWNCNMACAYCDTDYHGPYSEYTLESLLSEVRQQIRTAGPFHAVSLTGGEPLLWWKFLKICLPRLKALRQRTYLETNGTLPEALRELLVWTDIIAMDIKPPSATRDRAVWASHGQFLRMAHEAGRDLFVKIVVTGDTLDPELERACDLVAGVDSNIPVVLQPVTPWGTVREPPSEQQLDRWRTRASERLADVRVIPQVHRILGVR